MTAVFLILLTVALVGSATLITAGIVYLYNNMRMEHIHQLLGFLSTVTSIGTLAYAMWNTYGWWCIAISIAALAQSFYVIWVVYSRRPTGNSKYRVGGGNASPRIYR